MIKVLSLIPLEHAKTLLSNKYVEGYKTLPNLSDNTMSLLKFVASLKGEYSSIPLIGFYKFFGDDVDIVDNWDDMLNFLPASPEFIYFELQANENDCLFLDYDSLLKFETLNRRAMPRDKRLFLLEQLTAKMQSKPLGEDSLNGVVLLNGLDLAKCKYFAKIDSNWDRSELNHTLTMDMLQGLSAF